MLLTGASGSMGGEAFEELRRRKDRYDTVLLLRPSAENKKRFKRYLGGRDHVPAGGKGAVEAEGLKVVWGDLTDPADVMKAVNGVDFVLHPAALIAPAADHNPSLAEKINVGGTINIINAIKAQPENGDRVRFVYVGTVAEYGDRLPPIHVARVGDPLKPSVYDFYATTKIAAERAVIESGLKHWASIRQTYIAIPDVISLMDPIQFHQPINTHMELVTAEDAGYGLVQCLECPDDFYGRIYNMGGGPQCRVAFLEYSQKMLDILGLGDYRKIMDRNWFALRNFHCCWWEDSHILNAYLGHWRSTLQDHYQQVSDSTPWYTKLGKIAPPSLTRFFMKGHTQGKNGTLHWIKTNNQGRISAFFGSLEKWEAIPAWDVDMPQINGKVELLDHGYTEKPDNAYSIDDMKEAARFRGGECRSDEFKDMWTKLRWKCAFDHVFQATPTLILKAGHWCPQCAPPSWDYDRIARKNPFFAQVYYPNHDRDEEHFYDSTCYEDILK